jgi:signal transduction histidine kinase
MAAGVATRPSPQHGDRCALSRRRDRLLTSVGSGAFGILVLADPTAALSAPLDGLMSIPDRLDPHGAVGLAVMAGLVLFATTVAILHLSHRRHWLERDAELVAQNQELRARIDRADLLLAADPHLVVAWGGPSPEPLIEGSLKIHAEDGARRKLLAFGSWLPPDQAQALEAAMTRLRSTGESFQLTLTNLWGRVFEADGRAVTGRAVMRIREVSGDRLSLLTLQDQQTALSAQNDAFRLILDVIPQPVWVRDGDGALVWANQAYARAVDAASSDEAVRQHTELLDKSVRDEVARKRGAGSDWRGRVAAVMAGERRMLDVLERPIDSGSVGFATDVSELEAVRADLQRQMQGHVRTLDQLATAVAMFDGAKRLVFCNAAYRRLWQLDDAFFDQNPTDSEILDRLRSERRLPEQADYRSWKRQLHEAYVAIEMRETVWYLPDLRTLRVVVNPNPSGGVTYLFDDVTERFQLETRFNALNRVQGETLDSLKEGVAVFGTDGRLKLYNPAFAGIWRYEPKMLEARPHVEAVLGHCRGIFPDPSAWEAIRGLIAGLGDQRRNFQTRMDRRDGSILDCAAMQLPDGATLVTFADVTASVNVERALKERNEALEKAGQLRESFVNHVSYELRSPLTNVIGFTQLLADGTVGPLNDRQKDYAGHIMRSSAALMAIIDDILDLASIDTGEIELSLGAVDIQETIAAAVAGLQDRIAELHITLAVQAPASIGRFVADGKRVRQVLFNLLSNAVGFSKGGQTVHVSAERQGDEVVFTVSDQGRGIPPEIIDRVFDRFETHTLGSRHRGVGLGLSIVRSFVELHGGRVGITSRQGEGTTVTCVFPAHGEPARVAAA